MLILSAGGLDGEFSSLQPCMSMTGCLQFSSVLPPPTPAAKNFQELLTCHREGGASLPFSWTSGVAVASPASCWDNRKNLHLHLKPLIRYHKHLYTYNVAGEQQTDGSGETLTHFSTWPQWEVISRWKWLILRRRHYTLPYILPKCNVAVPI